MTAIRLAQGRFAAASALLLACAACSPVPRQCPTCSNTSQKAREIDAWRSQVPPPGPAAKLQYPMHTQVTLANGLRILSLNRPAGVVSLSLIVKVPPARLEISGRAALLARMLTEGTKALPGLGFAEAVEDLGTQIFTGADRDSAYLSVTVLPGDAESALRLLFDAATNPEFPAEALERVRAEWLAGLKARCDEPSQLAALVGLRALWGDLYGAPVQGTPSSIRGVNSSTLATLHAQWFVPTNAALVAVGDISQDELVRLATAASATWQARSPDALELPAAPSPRATNEVLVVDRKGAVQTALFVAQQMPPRSAPGYEARLVLNTALGGLFTSRINQNLREAHAYTYGAFSTVLASRYVGAWSAMTSVETRHTVAALQELLKERSAVGSKAGSRPLDAAEVDRARAALVARVGSHLQSADQIADDLGEIYVYGLDSQYFTSFGDALTRLGTAEVNAAGREWFGKPPPVVVAVGDGATLRPALESANLPTKVADITWLEAAE